MLGVTQIPTIALVLMICIASIFMRASIITRALPYRGRLDPLVMIFFLYLIIRYASDPVLPGYALGISNDVTGFRSWLNHLIGLILFLSFGFLITSVEAVQKLFRWLVLFSLVFTILFLGLMFVPGQELSSILGKMGIFVTMFGNGWRRFVFLPAMGTFLITASLLPNLFLTTPFQRRLFTVIGILAVVAGGGRGSVLTLLLTVGIILILKKRSLAFGALVAAVIGLTIIANTLVGHWSTKTVTPIVRIMGSFSPALSTEIGAMGTMEWRYIRWKRAMEDIRQHPWVGMGYGGVKNYFGVLSDFQETSPDLDVERDVAIGATHNGFISAARNLGIPFTLLFAIIGLWRAYVHWRKLKPHHPAGLLPEAHIFLCSYLAVMVLGMTIGGDITLTVNWLFIALSFVVESLDSGLSSATT
jgi:O-antigen ligase